MCNKQCTIYNIQAISNSASEKYEENQMKKMRK